MRDEPRVRTLREQGREDDLPWLRLSVQTHPLHDQGDEATVVLDRTQAAELRDVLTEWLSRVEGEREAS